MANNTGIKYGGRKKGTANKVTARLREAFTELRYTHVLRVKNKTIESPLDILVKKDKFDN